MGLRFAFGWMMSATLAAAITGCGGAQAPDNVDQEMYDDVMSATATSGLYEQCVHGGAYWSAYNKYAADPAKAINWPLDPWVNKDTEDRLLCGRSLHAILTAPWDGTAWHALAQAWIPAYVNVKLGAQAPQAVNAAFQQSFNLLMSCNVTTQEPAKGYAMTLKQWSAGNNGPATCGW